MNSIDLSGLQTQERVQARQLLTEFSDVISTDENDIGNVKDFQMKLNLKDDVPARASYNAILRNLYKELKHYIEDLLNKSWIRDSESPYSSLVVLVQEKHSTLQLCVDYQKLNAKIIPERHPLPRIQNVINNLGGKCCGILQKKFNIEMM